MQCLFATMLEKQPCPCGSGHGSASGISRHARHEVHSILRKQFMSIIILSAFPGPVQAGVIIAHHDASLCMIVRHR
eukprot:scaffold309373_cov27-Tisochrysis_lutea.AAC.1